MLALSFSRLSDYIGCPNKFKLKYVDKSYADDSDNPAFVKGNIIHKQLEDYINFVNGDCDEPSMNAATSSAKGMIENLHKVSKGNIFSEKQIAVDQDWVKCDWFAPPTKVKYRAIIDCLVFLGDDTLYIIDWKSGKVREYEDGPTTQLKLTAAMLFKLYPKIVKITSAYMFVEHKKTVKVDFERSQLDDLVANFDAAHTKVNGETEWAPLKNKYCNWCLATSDQCPVKK